MKGFSKKGTKREMPHASFEAGKIILTNRFKLKVSNDFATVKLRESVWRAKKNGFSLLVDQIKYTFFILL